MYFEDRAVAFIDILGFKSLVGTAVTDEKSFRELKGLVDLLSTAVPILDEAVSSDVPRHLVPKHIYISDCIILSAPLLDDSRKSFDGLAIVAMRVIQLSHFLLRAGYLMRGGIAVGKVWHTNSNIIGPAYQEAFQIEQCTREPIVVLSRLAAERWKGGSRMCLQVDGRVFANGLFDVYIPGSDKYGVIDETYKRYENLAHARLAEPLDDSARKKWEWFQEFLKSEAPDGLKRAQAN